jgi:hypothetical protein
MSGHELMRGANVAPGVAFTQSSVPSSVLKREDHETLNRGRDNDAEGAV